MRNARAIAWRISALGLRRPRSIWLRYGFEMPASSLSLRNDSRALRRWSRMNSPRSLSLDSRSGVIRPARSRLAHLVPGGQLGVHPVDHLVEPAPLLRHLLLQRTELADCRPQLVVVQARQRGERVVGDEVLTPPSPLDVHRGRETARQSALLDRRPGAFVGEDVGQRGDELTDGPT